MEAVAEPAAPLTDVKGAGSAARDTGIGLSAEGHTRGGKGDLDLVVGVGGNAGTVGQNRGVAGDAIELCDVSGGVQLNRNTVAACRSVG